MCNNLLWLAGNPYTVNLTRELAPEPQAIDSSLFGRIGKWLARIMSAAFKWLDGLPWQAKLWAGIKFLAAAICLAIVTHGTALAALPILLQVAVGVGIGILSYVISSKLNNIEPTSQGIAKAALNSFLISSIFVFVRSAVGSLKHLYRKRLIKQQLQAQAERYLSQLKQSMSAKQLEKLRFATVTYDPVLDNFTYAYNSEIPLSELHLM